MPDETFRTHVVVCQEGEAAEAGREVMRRGGNAVDAAVATAFALAVTHPAAGNIGGGGFIVAYLAGSKEVVTVDFREIAPKASTPTMYLGPNGLPKPGHRAGAKAAGVPGTVRGLGLAHAKWGKALWADLVRPASKLARDGIKVSQTLASSLNGQLFPRQNLGGGAVPEDLGPQGDRLADFAASVAAFKKSDGSRWLEGDLLVQRDLADTLDRIADRGPDEFYTGLTAKKVVAHMEKLGGLISLDDLAGYEAKARPPIHGTYKGLRRLRDGPPRLGRHPGRPDAQHPGTIRPEGRRPPIGEDRAPGGRGDAPGVLQPGDRDRRPRLRAGPDREADLEVLRRRDGEIDRRTGPPRARAWPRSRS